MKTSLGKWVILPVLLLALSCSNNDFLEPGPTASVAGTWTMLATNIGSAVPLEERATFFKCNGDLLFLEGLMWDAASALAVSGSGIQPSVNQNGNTFDLVPTTVNGITYTGGGFVNLTAIFGRFEYVDPANAVGLTMLFNGEVNGNSMVLHIRIIEAGNGFSGQCTVSPRLNLDVAVS